MEGASASESPLGEEKPCQECPHWVSHEQEVNFHCAKSLGLMAHLGEQAALPTYTPKQRKSQVLLWPSPQLLRHAWYVSTIQQTKEQSLLPEQFTGIPWSQWVRGRLFARPLLKITLH